MSIINDALRKARKEFEFKDISMPPSNINKPDEEKPVSLSTPAEVSDKKWTTLVVVSLVVIASILGSIFLYKNMAHLKEVYIASTDNRTDSTIQTTLNQVERKITFKRMKPEDAVKLSGIVYGPEGKWAIVNNRIIKEGDTLLSGEVTSITKDFVRVKRNDGSEIILSLK